MIKNKKGGERVLSLYWFLILGIVAIVVVSGVFIFYSAQTDVREVETNILADKIIQCFVNNGVFDSVKFIKSETEGIEKTCNLVLNDLSYKYQDPEQYYVKVTLMREGIKKEIKTRMQEYEPYCGQKRSKKNIPLCAEKRIMVLDGNNFVLLEVLTAVRKVEQNAVQ